MRNTHELANSGDLTAFIAVVDSDGFAEAGRTLNLAPSTLSRAVSRLESQFGIALLRRSTRGVELTPEGAKFLEASRQIVGQMQDLHDVAADGQTPKGPLRIDAPIPFVMHVLAPALPEFCAQYPDVQLTLDMSDTVTSLLGSHADIAIRFGPVANSDLLHRKLGQAHWRLVASPDYLSRMGAPETPEDLVRLDQVLFTNPTHINELRFHSRSNPIRPQPGVSATNGEAVRKLVLSGLGIARFSEYMVRKDIEAGRLVELFTDDLQARPLEITALYMTRTTGLRRLSVFLDWLEGLLKASR